jgi:predicted secreted protein
MAVTTDVISGNRVLVFANDEAIACTTGATLSITNAEIETTCKDDDGAVTRTPGNQDWNIQVSGNSKFDAAFGIRDLNPIAKNKSTVTVRFGTENADDPYWEGDAFISSYSFDAPLNAASTWSITFSPRSPILLFNT